MCKEQKSLSKIKDIKYECVKIQEYLKSPNFNQKERNLLYALRSRSHPAKLNYRKINSFNLKCSLGCQENEHQYHIFENCTFLNTEKANIRLNSIFEDTVRQKEAIGRILIIESNRLKLKEALQSQPEL